MSDVCEIFSFHIIDSNNLKEKYLASTSKISKVSYFLETGNSRLTIAHKTNI